ncbi:MAG: 16S rRNA processing protein RimM [Candidatus Eisenbacteria sp.]|nr:16S rRNA processing protein RimM [Candidatus Eisenbacteria bacterium]
MDRHGEETWVPVGRVGRPFGLKGEVVIHYTGDTSARFHPGEKVQVVTPHGRVPATIVRARALSKKFVVVFAGRESIEAVKEWVNCPLEVRARDLPPLEEGRYYHFQLIGLKVYAADGRFIGLLEEVWTTGGNDVYCVRHDGREVLVPAIEDAIVGIDLEQGTMNLKNLEGMIEP